jgi:hypothetical protein
MSHPSLWLGEDHLLCVDSNGYAETYKRFYFRDVQAITDSAQTRRRVDLELDSWRILVAFCLASCNFGSLFKSQPDMRKRLFFFQSRFLFSGFRCCSTTFSAELAPVSCTLRFKLKICRRSAACGKTRNILEKIRPLIAADARPAVTRGNFSANARNGSC